MAIEKHFNPIEYIECPEFSTTPAVFISDTTSTEVVSLMKRTLQRSFVDFSLRRATDEDLWCGKKFFTLYIFYWIKVFLNCLLLFHLVFYFTYIYVSVYVNICVLVWGLTC